jgi:hypothetical protein
MNTKTLAAIGVAATLVSATFATAQGRPPKQDAELQQLTRWMIGSFGSGKQATTDSTYFDVRLHMARVWPNRTDGVWLYVEQALATRATRPYRQRVYRLERRRSDGVLTSKVYALPDPRAAVGAWAQVSPLAKLSPNDLVERPGAVIELKADGPDRFVGSTVGDRCKSTFRGAAYATSEVEVRAKSLVSWDRGYDADGKQVWGATEGGYVFDRLPAAVDAPQSSK